MSDYFRNDEFDHHHRGEVMISSVFCIVIYRGSLLGVHVVSLTPFIRGGDSLALIFPPFLAQPRCVFLTCKLHFPFSTHLHPVNRT